MTESLLDIQNLQVVFRTDQGPVHAVNGLNLSIERGKVTALVGESGCGKSVSALSILRLLESPPAETSAGRILFQGKDLLTIAMKELRQVRGNQIAMIFQEPMTSLNPVFTVGDQIAEVYQVHQGLSKQEALRRTVENLKQVGIPNATERAHSYPHELSGGMRQRVMIAMAIACSPKLLIADEPTTALDVTVQAQILKLLKELQEKNHMGLLLITHDLGIVAEIADHVAVMYAGEIVEQGSVMALFDRPAHPYTRGLLDALPSFGKKGELAAIPGRVPRFFARSEACTFAERCAYTQNNCRESHPELEEIELGHWVRCYYPLKKVS